jgi:hemolysin activation/secretion protein
MAALRVAFFMAFGVLFASTALAQLDPNIIAPVVPRQTEPRPEIPGPVLDSEDLPIGARSLPRIHIPVDDPTASALSGGTITVRGFRFLGNTLHSDEDLAAVTNAYVGVGRRYSALLEARDRVTRLYIDSGYISSGAILGQQDYADGIVELTIVEGMLTNIEFETDGRLRERYFTSRINPRGEALNVNDLRERLRRLKRDPRVDAITAELLPGDERGDSVLSIVVEEATPYWSAASFDNYTPESIGGLRGYFRGGHRNITGWGETFTAAYGIAEGLHDLDLRFDAPVTRFDTTLGFTVRRSWAEIVEEPLDALDIENKTEAYGIRLEQPVLRRRGEEARLFVAGEWKRGRTFIAGERGFGGDDTNRGKSTITVLRTGGDYLLRLQKRAFAARITASFGIDVLSATPAVSAETIDTPDGKFITGLIQLQEVEYLPWNDMRLQTRIDAQVVDGAIPALEQFGLGGNASVRGFRENLAVRDQGVVGSVELRIPVAVIGPIESLEFGVFTDSGYGRYRDSATGSEATTLVSIGFGVHADITPYIRTSIEWAKDLKEKGVKSQNDLQDDGLHFSLQARFP